MRKLKFVLFLSFLSLSGCASQSQYVSGASVAPYSLEALDYAYHQKAAQHG